jgi:phage terminase large subunit-like protein
MSFKISTTAQQNLNHVFSGYLGHCEEQRDEAIHNCMFFGLLQAQNS